MAKNSGSRNDFPEIFGKLSEYYARRRLYTALDKVARQDEPFRVLISTVISQRTKDEVTEKASKRLFSRFPTIQSLAAAQTKDVEECIRDAGFYRTKSTCIIQIAKIIERRYGCAVPDSIEEMMELPLVGRKTANCVLVYGFGKAAIPVDTHVHRISNRLGIVSTRNVEETERELRRQIPRRFWIGINELFVLHGRSVCRPISPRCEICPVSELCAFFRTGKSGERRSSKGVSSGRKGVSNVL
ncbi:MAG: endonuclease III [Thermoplasmata archaeon]|uniref:Endonuclease III n=1 Tax=Candidatus Sysuiplasma superficiale TaxID=2823368 RepID=A0A8J8CH38_9ARCH|nr:endonuclease III [Candidatus Sysuiplasma superficiale]MBX8643463.1 endonuclease III [Candidatus Sysuiplasma superficiale]MCL4346667.1 endonuclease III [Candidatus Thermoplasmatota archaeon]